MLEKEYRKYLLDDCEENENITVNQIIVRLFKDKKIDLDTATRLKKIFNKLLQLPNVDAFNITENLTYKSENEIEKIKLEIAYLMKKFIVKNIEKQTIDEEFSRLQNYLAILNNNKLSKEELEQMKRNILFIELDNGYDFKFLVCADNYLKENVKKYYKK